MRHVVPAIEFILILLAVAALLLNTTPAANAGNINTETGWQDSPYISLDGERLYFTYTRFNFGPFFKGGLPVLSGPMRPGHHSNPNAWQDTDNYVVGRDPDGNWRQGTIVNFPFNTNTSDCCGMEYADGGQIKFLYLKAEGDSNSGVFMESTLIKGKWTQPVIVGRDVLYTSDAVEDNPHITILPDGNAFLVFASNRQGGFGEKDLYLSIRPSGSSDWSEPRNMGTNINTTHLEDQPWLSPDGKILFFTRGTQIFESRWTGTGWLPARHILLGDLQVIAEPSLTSDLQELFFLSVDTTASPWRTEIMRASRKSDHSWYLPEPVD
jgi:hypothetical protein